MSAFSSIKLKKSINDNDNSLIQRNSGMYKASNNVHNLDREFKKKDANDFNEFMTIKKKKDCEKAKFFKNIDNENKTNEKKMLDIPRDVRKSKEELAKIHLLDQNNTNSGLTKIAYSPGVKNLMNQFKENDTNDFKVIKDEKLKENLIKAKFFKNIDDEKKTNEKKMLDIPRDVRKSEEELAKIHLLDRNSASFVERESSDSTKIVNMTISNTEQRDENINNIYVKPKEKRFQEDIKLAKKNKQQYTILVKNILKPQSSNEKKKSFLSQIVDDSRNQFKSFDQNKQNMNNDYLKPKEQRFQEDVQMAKNESQLHKVNEKKEFTSLLNNK